MPQTSDLRPLTHVQYPEGSSLINDRVPFMDNTYTRAKSSKTAHSSLTA